MVRNILAVHQWLHDCTDTGKLITVCCLWRNIVEHNPLLWTTLILQCPRHFMPMLDKWLEFIASLLWIISFLARSIFPSLCKNLIWFSAQALVLFLTWTIWRSTQSKSQYAKTSKQNETRPSRASTKKAMWRDAVTRWRVPETKCTRRYGATCANFSKNSESFSTPSTIFGWERDKLWAKPKWIGYWSTCFTACIALLVLVLHSLKF